MELKPDHANRRAPPTPLSTPRPPSPLTPPASPLWVCPDGRVFLESFSPVYKQASDFLVAVAEPVCRPEVMHEYALTPHSLYAAVSVGLQAATILAVLGRLCKTALPAEIGDFVRASTQNYGKVKLVLHKNRFWLESAFPDVLRTLLADEVVAAARVAPPPGAAVAAPFTVAPAPREEAAAELAATGGAADGGGPGAAAAAAAEAAAPLLQPGGGEGIGGGDDGDRQLHSFELDPAQVEKVKQRCLPGGLNLPTLEEYDFRNDSANPDVAGLELKPAAQVRPYQEKSLSKMFGNGRARSGIIVLPCGAGKSLTGIAAAARVRKSVLVLCTSAVSVDQWRQQFKMWTQLPDAAIARFTSQLKESLPDGCGGGSTQRGRCAHTQTQPPLRVCDTTRFSLLPPPTPPPQRGRRGDLHLQHGGLSGPPVGRVGAPARLHPGPRVGPHAAGRGARRPRRHVPQGCGHHQGALQAGADRDAGAGGRAHRPPQLPHRPQTVRGQLAGPAAGRVHRERAVRGGVVPHDQTVLRRVFGPAARGPPPGALRHEPQ